MIRNHIMKLMLAYCERSEPLIGQGMDPLEVSRELDRRIKRLAHHLNEIDQPGLQSNLQITASAEASPAAPRSD